MCIVSFVEYRSYVSFTVLFFLFVILYIAIHASLLHFSSCIEFCMWSKWQAKSCNASNWQTVSVHSDTNIYVAFCSCIMHAYASESMELQGSTLAKFNTALHRVHTPAVKLPHLQRHAKPTTTNKYIIWQSRMQKKNRNNSISIEWWDRIERCFSPNTKLWSVFQFWIKNRTDLMNRYTNIDRQDR